ncbi:MAG: hypothetical protein WKF84_00225 [Pyrinomonadaceae bacterium]
MIAATAQARHPESEKTMKRMRLASTRWLKWRGLFVGAYGDHVTAKRHSAGRNELRDKDDDQSEQKKEATNREAMSPRRFQSVALCISSANW